MYNWYFCVPSVQNLGWAFDAYWASELDLEKYEWNFGSGR